MHFFALETLVIREFLENQLGVFSPDPGMAVFGDSFCDSVSLGSTRDLPGFQHKSAMGRAVVDWLRGQDLRFVTFRKRTIRLC